MGQFGRINKGFTSEAVYALNGTSGNAYSPSLVTGTDGQTYLFHNVRSILQPLFLKAANIYDMRGSLWLSNEEDDVARTRITTCYPNRVDAGPYFVPGLQQCHVVA